MIDLFARIVSSFILVSPSISSAEVSTYLIQSEVTSPPFERELPEDITASSYLVFDLYSGTAVLEHNAKQQRAMASLTKLMTALLIMENESPSRIVTVPEEAWKTEGTKIDLLENEQMSIYNLMKGLLMSSGNDAAVTLAIAHSGSIEKFSEEMNVRAKFLGMYDTHFVNPHGLDAESHYSTAYDLAYLAQYLLKKHYDEWGNFFRTTIATQVLVISSIDGEHDHFLENTNKFLGTQYPVYGMKTGTTDFAGECLLTYFKTEEYSLLIIVLGSEDRYTDTERLMQLFL